MKMRIPVLALLFVWGMVPPLAAQDRKTVELDPQVKAMIEMLDRYGTPGPEHQKFLDRMGTWDVESKTWTDPAAPPRVTKGVSVFRLILGGRYLQCDFEGKAMDMAFKGYGLSGYDRYNKKYVGLWLDTMSTGFVVTEGTCDAEGKVCTETGAWDDYAKGRKVGVRNVYTTLDRDRFTMEMFMVLPDGKEVKSMELTYTRRK